jgi:hypothetical protein
MDAGRGAPSENMIIRAFFRLVTPILAPFFRRLFLSAFEGAADKPLWVVDIDNTIAQTWPSFIEKHKSEAERLLSLPPLEGMCARIRGSVPRTTEVIFLSVRPYWTYFLTRQWLLAQRLPFSVSNLVLVGTPEEKL